MSDNTRIVDTTLTIAQLRLSPFNVRTDLRDATATEALEASILERGLMQPLNVHKMKGGTTWGAFAGGRRYRSIKNLIERGALPADWPVPVREYVGFSEAQLIEQSLAENMLRRDLRDYELFAGIRRAHARGESVEAIAAALGQETTRVRRWLRLGELAEPVFAAFKADQITGEHAEAYAATSDTALQLAVFQQLQPLPFHERTAAKIRAALKVGDAEATRQLRFVGDEAYLAAGGRFELDLFADAADMRGRVVDEGILRQLVDAKLDETRKDLRRRSGRPDLRFVPQPPQREGFGTDYSLQIHPTGAADGQIKLPDGDIVARLWISESGVPSADWWWASRAAKFGNEKPARAPVPAARALGSGAAVGQKYDGARQTANAAIKEEAGLTADAIEIFRTLRCTILRAILVTAARNDRTVGRDYLVWAQLRMLLTDDRSATVGMRPFAGPSDSFGAAHAHGLAKDHVAATQAAKEWDEALAELRCQPFLTEKDLPAAFIAFHDAPLAMRDLAAAVAAGLALERSLNAPGYQIPVHDTVAAFARLSTDRAVRDIWAPTEALIGMLPKKEQLAIAEPLVENAVYASWGRLKAAEVTPLVVSALAGTAGALRKTMRDAALRWVHPLLSFRPDRRADAAAELHEAAE